MSRRLPRVLEELVDGGGGDEGHAITYDHWQPATFAETPGGRAGEADGGAPFVQAHSPRQLNGEVAWGGGGICGFSVHRLRWKFTGRMSTG